MQKMRLFTKFSKCKKMQIIKIFDCAKNAHFATGIFPPCRLLKNLSDVEFALPPDALIIWSAQNPEQHPDDRPHCPVHVEEQEGSTRPLSSARWAPARAAPRRPNASGCLTPPPFGTERSPVEQQGPELIVNKSVKGFPFTCHPTGGGGTGPWAGRSGEAAGAGRDRAGETARAGGDAGPGRHDVVFHEQRGGVPQLDPAAVPHGGGTLPLRVIGGPGTRI